MLVRSALASPASGRDWSAAAVSRVSQAVLGIDVPVAHQERPRAGVEERAGQPGQPLRARFAARAGGVAGREHHEVGVEVQARDLARSQEPVVPFAGGGRAQRQRRLGEPGELAREQAVGRERDGPVAAEIRAPEGVRQANAVSPRRTTAPGSGDEAEDEQRTIDQVETGLRSRA